MKTGNKFYYTWKNPVTAMATANINPTTILQAFAKAIVLITITIFRVISRFIKKKRYMD